MNPRPLVLLCLLTPLSTATITHLVHMIFGALIVFFLTV